MSVGADTAAYRWPIRHRMAEPLVLLALATIDRNPRRCVGRKKM
jgi:hypothetical protein